MNRNGTKGKKREKNDNRNKTNLKICLFMSGNNKITNSKKRGSSFSHQYEFNEWTKQIEHCRQSSHSLDFKISGTKSLIVCLYSSTNQLNLCVVISDPKQTEIHLIVHSSYESYDINSSVQTDVAYMHAQYNICHSERLK